MDSVSSYNQMNDLIQFLKKHEMHDGNEIKHSICNIIRTRAMQINQHVDNENIENVIAFQKITIKSKLWKKEQLNP